MSSDSFHIEGPAIATGIDGLDDILGGGFTPNRVYLAICELKKRRGKHERTIREFRLTDQGIQVGEPLRQFQGVLTGVPMLNGATISLKDAGDE